MSQAAGEVEAGTVALAGAGAGGEEEVGVCVGGSGKEAEALGGALQMMVQALAHMQEAMQTMNTKMFKTDEALHSVADTVQRLDAKMDTVERSLQFALQHAAIRDAQDEARRKKLRAARRKLKQLPQSPSPAAFAVAATGASLPSPPPLPPPAASFSNLFQCARDAASTSPGSSLVSSSSASSLGPLPKPPTTSHSQVRMTRSSMRLAPPPPTMSRRVALGRALLRAAQNGAVHEIRRLLKEGADVNYSNSSKWTPLHMAAVKAQADALQLLLERGAAVNARNAFGFAPLHMAAHNDSSARCVSLLVYGGADVDAANRFGRTPLHYAAECSNDAALRALLSAGAGKLVRDDEGRTPLDVAKTDAVRRLLAPKPFYA